MIKPPSRLHGGAKELKFSIRRAARQLRFYRAAPAFLTSQGLKGGSERSTDAGTTAVRRIQAPKVRKGGAVPSSLALSRSGLVDAVAGERAFSALVQEAHHILPAKQAG